ncbi:hypothetical protein BOC44_20875 (plasmid) [Burkholderia pseudomallei]|nr:hypothetical protein BOC44_20875 [Burkholderia pseudomallei]
MVANSYPLEIENIENVGDDDYIVMARGHHDPHEFMKKVREAGYDWPLGFPSHHWIKSTPARDGVRYHMVPAGTRGAFPATYAHEAYREKSYEAVCVAKGIKSTFAV